MCLAFLSMKWNNVEQCKQIFSFKSKNSTKSSHGELVRSIPKFTANLYCIRFGIDLRYIWADTVHICGKFWDTQYDFLRLTHQKWNCTAQSGRFWLSCSWYCRRQCPPRHSSQGCACVLQPRSRTRWMGYPPAPPLPTRQCYKHLRHPMQNNYKQKNPHVVHRN